MALPRNAKNMFMPSLSYIAEPPFNHKTIHCMPRSGEAIVRWGVEINQHLIDYSLRSISAKILKSVDVCQSHSMPRLSFLEAHWVTIFGWDQCLRLSSRRRRSQTKVLKPNHFSFCSSKCKQNKYVTNDVVAYSSLVVGSIINNCHRLKAQKIKAGMWN